MGDAYASHSEAATTSVVARVSACGIFAAGTAAATAVVARVSRAGFSQRSRHPPSRCYCVAGGCLYSYGGAPL